MFTQEETIPSDTQNNPWQLQINPNVPSNALVPSSRAAQHHPKGSIPPSQPKPTGEKLTLLHIQSLLWSNRKLEQRKYWLNLFLSVGEECNEIGFVRKPLGFPDHSDSEFYKLAFENRNMLNECSRCNLVTHQNEYFEKVIMEGLYIDYLNKKQWTGLLTHHHFRSRVLSLAVTNPIYLSFFLEHTDITTEELNTLATKACYDDFRLGKVRGTVTPAEWIIFLNQQTEKTRLAYLCSDIPFNEFAWLQIPKLDQFSVGDAKLILTLKGRGINPARAQIDQLFVDDIDDEVPPVPQQTVNVSADNLDQTLSSYIALHNVDFSVSDFLKMRGESISANDFLRVNCDHYSFEDFTSFMSSYLNANDFQKINGVLACFFSTIMKSPNQLLAAVDSPGHPNYPLMTSLSATTKVFDEVIRCARFAKEGLSSNARLQLSQPNVAVVTLEGDHWYNLGKDFVITNDGIASASAIPSENYHALLDSARLSIASGNIRSAARDYCIALTIEQDPKIINEAYSLIQGNLFTELYPALEMRIASYMDNLLSEINRSTSSLQNKLELISEVGFLIIKLASISVAGVEPICRRFEDALQRLTLEIISITDDGFMRNEGLYANTRSSLFLIWKRLADVSSGVNRARRLIECVKLGNSYQRKEVITIALSTAPFKTLRVATESIAEESIAAEGVPTESAATIVAGKRLLLESVLTSPKEMLSLLTRWFCFGKEAQLKTFLQTFPISINNIERIIQEINTFSVFLDTYDEQHRYVQEMKKLLLNIYIDNIKTDDLQLARAIYAKINGVTEYKEFYEQLIVCWLDKVNDGAVRFLLSGEESKLCDELRQTVWTGKELSSPFMGKREKYLGTLEKMCKEQDTRAVMRLASLDIDLNECSKQNGFPLIISLFMNKDGSLRRYTREMEELMRLISADTAGKILERFIEKNIPIPQYLTPSLRNIYLSIFSRCDKSTQILKMQAIVHKCIAIDNIAFIHLLFRESKDTDNRVSFAKFVDITWLVNAIREATVEQRKMTPRLKFLLAFARYFVTVNPLRSPQAHMLNRRINMTYQQLLTFDRTLDFVLSGEESKWYIQLYSMEAPIAESTVHETNEKYAWLFQQMVSERNAYALDRLIQSNARCDMDANTKKSLLLILLRAYDRSQENIGLVKYTQELSVSIPKLIFSEKFLRAVVPQEAKLFLLTNCPDKEERRRLYIGLMTQDCRESMEDESYLDNEDRELMSRDIREQNSRRF